MKEHLLKIGAVWVIVAVLVLGFSYASARAKAAEREKEYADRIANRTAYESNAITKCKTCGGDGNDCTNCYDGKCPACDGKGQVYLSGYVDGYYYSPGKYGCRYCHLTGVCAVCQGDGSCSDCNSTGIELKYSSTDCCKTCKGTGICLKCDGKGCSYCDHGYCASCDRTGQAQ